MTFNATESSSYGGSPIEFYKFKHGTATHNLVSGSEDEYGPLGVLYSARQITRSDAYSSNELNKNPIELLVDASNEIAQYFVRGQPDEIIFLTKFVRNLSDTDSEFLMNWQGRVSNCKFEGDFAKLVCEPVSTSAKRLGLRAKYQKLCRHSLYDARCGAFEINENITVVSVSGTTITVSGLIQPNGYFNGGNLVMSNNSMRMITNQVGNVLTVTHQFNDINPDDVGIAVAGCDHRRETCRDKFNNFLNFGGFPYIPTKNPFTDGPINQ